MQAPYKVVPYKKPVAEKSQLLGEIIGIIEKRQNQSRNPAMLCIKKVMYSILSRDAGAYF